MQNANQIINDIKNKKFAPIYFLMGDEAFFIDLITEELEKSVLTEVEKSFNQTVFYGRDIDVKDVVAQAKQFPMMSKYTLVIVKEAQHLSRSIEQLESYVAQPLESTILVFNYKSKTLDKRKKLYKALQKNSVLLESKKLYDNQIPDWIESTTNQMRMRIDVKAKFLLAEYIGNDLSRILSELQKLKIILGTEQHTIEADLIEKNIGISKDYNNFELLKALGSKDLKKVLSIVNYFDRNPKNHPIVVTISVLYNFFSSLIIYHSLVDKSANSVARELKINPYFVKDYQQAARSFSLKKNTRAISFLRELDVKSKGVNHVNSSHSGLLMNFIMQIFQI